MNGLAAVDETRRAMRLLGLGVLLMTAIITLTPMVLYMARSAPASVPGLAVLVAGQMLCLLALGRREVPRWLPWALLGLTLAGMVWMLLTRGPVSATNWAPGYWMVPLVALAMASLPRSGYFRLTAAATVAVGGLLTLLSFEPTWRWGIDLVWVVQPPLTTLLFGDALLSVARSRDQSEMERLDAQLTRRQAALDDHDMRETTRLLHDHVLHALHGLSRTTPQTAGLVTEDCRTACLAVRTRRRAQADQLAALEQVDRTAAAAPTGPWHITPNPQTRRALVNTVWPALGAALGTALLAGPNMEDPELLVPLALAVVTVAAAVAVHLMSRPLNPVIGLLLAATAVLGWHANLTVAPTDTLDVYSLWLAWIVSPIIHLVALSSRLVVSATVAGTWLVVQTAGLFWRFGDLGQVMTLSSTVSTGAVECIITVLVLAVVRRQAAREARAMQIADEVSGTIRRLQDAYRRDLRWSERVTREVLPLLQRVADGTHDPLDPQVRQTASRLETTVRDQLLLGHEQEPLATALARVRSDGWQVDSTLDGHDPAASLEAMTRLLGLLGPASTPGQPLTLSATQVGAAAVALGQVTAGQEAHWEGIVQAGGRVDVAEDFARILMPARTDPAPSTC